ncbi:UbiX family flavin prenyltransferase [Desulfonatronovibrio hydrogenovorans]|uniref:UbiX family flavin prenyltransferase n=1 Tax=Desulfonatronovibrio hydrogenovorans TaxID=53245 RepID=UPI00048D585D|nr:UbiX family flavin prenyltransferase [Desulfonatronovibrio hydrogenovorans]
MKKIILALTGASGMPYGLELIRQIKKQDFELHLILSDAARMVLDLEAPGHEQVLSLADHVFSQDQLGAPASSGSFFHQGMIVCPCSMASLAAIANGLGNNLVHRAADVCLKEKRPLILVPRETPLNRIHLENMLKAHDCGATILPPCPGFYHGPQSMDDLIKHITGRILDALGIENNLFKRWEGV